jgi:hypothetical protein
MSTHAGERAGSRITGGVAYYTRPSAPRARSLPGEYAEGARCNE